MVTRRVSSPVAPMSSSSKPIDILILGAGWTSTFLIPLLKSHSIPFAATTTTGHDDTIPFRFDPDSSDTAPYKSLPDARTVLITFPLKGSGQSRKLVSLYEKSRSKSSASASAGTSAEPPQSSTKEPRLYIQLGSTGIFTAPHWNDSSASYDTTNARAIAEDELLSLATSASASASDLDFDTTSAPITSTVLNLSGLYGGARDPKAWLPRIIKTKGDIAGRKALHLVHGKDVARAVLGAHEHRGAVGGKRWIVTDLHVYDWWELIFEWAGQRGGDDVGKGGEVAGGTREMELDGELVDLQKTVFECMNEAGVRALPRGPETLGRVLDGRGFWKAVDKWPVVGRVT